MSRPQGHSATRRIKSQWIIPMTPLAIEPPTFRLPTQYLNQLYHPVPWSPVGGQGIFSSPESIRTSPRAHLASSKEALSGWKAIGAWHWPPSPSLAPGLCFMACYREKVTFYSSSFQHCVSNLLVSGETQPPSHGIDERSRIPHDSIIRSHLYNY